MNTTTLNNNLRNSVLKDLIEFVATKYDAQAISVDSGAIAIPVVDEEGNEKYAKIVVSIPRGTRNGNGGYNEYNAYVEETAYKLAVANREAKRKASEARKEAKRKADEAKREAKKVVKELNEKGLDEMIKEEGE